MTEVFPPEFFGVIESGEELLLGAGVGFGEVVGLGAVVGLGEGVALG